MAEESASLHPEAPLGPLAQKWVDDLTEWYSKLQAHFGFDPSDLPKNLRMNLDKWKARLSYLKPSHPGLYYLIISNIEHGHKIPLERSPRKFFRGRNPPSLAADRERAWTAIKKDIAHGALRPVDIKTEGIPHCVCPVRTADKSDGSARFVHNSRRVNKCIPKKESKCKLESLLRARNMFIPDGFAVGLDFSSGYHCISMHPDDRKYLAFALHESELPQQAVEWLHANHPEAYLPERRCFIFEYIALPFGLSSSCRTFNDLVTALLGFWRRCPLDGRPTRASSYIDDVLGVTLKFDSVSCEHSVTIVTMSNTTNAMPTGYAFVDTHGIRSCFPGIIVENSKVLVLPKACDQSPWYYCRPVVVYVQCHKVESAKDPRCNRKAEESNKAKPQEGPSKTNRLVHWLNLVYSHLLSPCC